MLKTIPMQRLFFLLILSFLSCNNDSATGHNNTAERQEKHSLNNPDEIKELRKKALLARAYCKRHKMNTEVAILIDMNIPSGLKRFVVWDYKKDTIAMAGLVTHGCGMKQQGRYQSVNGPVFSNNMDSHCSSLGKYKIGERGYSSWGIHVNYLLHGLEKTNDNALARTVVLHSWDAIPNKETYPAKIAESWGCPAVSNDFMMAIDNVLKNTSKPVLLWIYV